MTAYRGPYYPAHACTGGPTPGALALMAWFLGAYKARGARNLGIYNCRPIAGTQVLSLHAEGRASDLGGPRSTWMDGTAQLLHDVSVELGIQLIIYNRRVWSCRATDAWLPYNGVNPHTDHIHTELIPYAAQHLTVARVNAAVLAYRILPVLRQGATGDAVKRLQRELNSGLVLDGIFGPRTARALRAFQISVHLAPDEVAGPRTWFALLIDD